MSFSGQIPQFRPLLEDQLYYVMSPRAPTPTSRNTHVRTPTPVPCSSPTSTPTPTSTPRRLSSPALSTVCYDCLRCNKTHKITYAPINDSSHDFKVISTEDCFIAYEIGKQILGKLVKDMNKE